MFLTKSLNKKRLYNTSFKNELNLDNNLLKYTNIIPKFDANF